MEDYISMAKDELAIVNEKLKDRITVTKKEAFLGLLACTVVGIIIGLIIGGSKKNKCRYCDEECCGKKGCC